MQPTTMRAVVLESTGSAASSLILHPNHSIPQPQPGQVLIRIRAFGLNHSELVTRLGEAIPMGPTPLPRILGIECVGIVASAPGSEADLPEGIVVMAALGGLGRVIDGSYAEFCVISKDNVIAIAKSEADLRLPWEVLGAVPEMVQTAHGCLFRALNIKKGEKVLVRGGTSGVGSVAISLAKSEGCEVVATTRSPSREAQLREAGADHVIVDNQGKIKEAVNAVYPGGVDKILELVGTLTVLDSLQCLTQGGVCCVAGTLGGKWALDNFVPLLAIPLGRYLTSYGVMTFRDENTPWQDVLGKIERKEVKVGLGKVYHGLESVVEAHEVMEKDAAGGKVVIVL